MDLKPLYELRERLRAGAIAGAALAADDFRLKRAVEALAPLEKAAPVFAKLGELARGVLAPDCPDRAGALLDAISLCDAVLCTQGAVAAEGPVEPLPEAAGGAVITNAPYSVLAPLTEALTTSGGGRYSFVMETHEVHPELFEDYRVKDALVKALGASFSELADNAEEWLSRDGESLLPLLERDFDPKGKREMVRRVHLMEKVAGAGANDFYLSVLPQAEKEVRGALIFALRLDENNAQKLVELCKTEKGSCKKMAHWALSRLESPAAWDYWRALAAKKPEQAADYMVLSPSRKASDLIGGALLEALAPYEADPAAPITKEFADRFQRLLYALPAKCGETACAFWRRAAALGTALDRPMEGERKPFLWKLSDVDSPREAVPFSGLIPPLFRQSIRLNPAPDLLALAEEFHGAYGERFAASAIIAALLTRPAGACYELAKPFLQLKKGVLPSKKDKRLAPQVIRDALGDVCWSGSQNRQVMRIYYWDPALEGTTSHKDLPLFETLDRRFYDDLLRMGKGADCDPLIFDLVPGPAAGEELCAYLGEELYRRAKLVGDNRGYLSPLSRCGWPTCEGLMESYFTRRRATGWEYQSYAARLPGTRESAGAEAARVFTLIQEKKIPVVSWNPEPLPKWLQERFGVTVEL